MSQEKQNKGLEKIVESSGRYKSADKKKVLECLREAGVKRLDDITPYIIYKRPKAWRILGIPASHILTVFEAQELLVRYGILSPFLQDLDAKTQSAFIDTFFTSTRPAVFTGYMNWKLGETIIRKNAKFIFEVIKVRGNIQSLTDITLENVKHYSKFWKVIARTTNTKFRNVKEIKKAIVYRGLLSPQISDYSPELQKQIINQEIMALNDHSYLDKEIVTDSYQGNIRPVFEEIKKQEHIDYIDDIDTRIMQKYRSFWRAIGIRPSSSHNFKLDTIKSRLVGLKLLSASLRDYSENVQKKILASIIKPGLKHRKSFFLHKSLGLDLWHENFSMIWATFCEKEKITNLDDICHEHSQRYKGFWTNFRFKNAPSSRDIRLRLVSLQFFSEKISDYAHDVRHAIIVNILTPRKKSFHSYYFDPIKPEIKKENMQLILKELIKKENISHLDVMNNKILRKYEILWAYLGVQRKRRYFTLDSIRDFFVESGLFSTTIKNYYNGVQEKILIGITHPKTKSPSYYFNSKLDPLVRKDNLTTVWSYFKKKAGVRSLDDLTHTLFHSHRGFWKFPIGAQITRNTGDANDVRTRLLHLGHFHTDVENKYTKIIHYGTVIDLLKQLDYDLFGYDDVEFDKNKVDQISYALLTRLHKEAQTQEMQLHNALELFEYYQSRYEHGSKG